MTSSFTYRDAGVDIDAGDELVERIKPHVRRSMRPEVLAGLGGFGALFEVPVDRYRRPVLVSGTDGVGTKLRLAIETGRHDTIGIDLVAMCANDVVVQGAEPLYFLDYYATGKLSVDAAEAVIKGIVEGCVQAGAALIGGETAEMPGVYAGKDYDLAGFAVGAVEREGLLPRADIGPGDQLIALASSGVHSNGYSLVRRIVARGGHSYDTASPFSIEQTLAEALLTPTRIYVRPLLAALKRTSGIKGFAHITGGGITDNLPRILPAGAIANVDLGTIAPPPVFGWLAAEGNVVEREMLRTFNCGVGMIVVADADRADAVLSALAEEGERAWLLGELATGEADAPTVRYRGALSF